MCLFQYRTFEKEVTQFFNKLKSKENENNYKNPDDYRCIGHIGKL